MNRESGKRPTDWLNEIHNMFLAGAGLLGTVVLARLGYSPWSDVTVTVPANDLLSPAALALDTPPSAAIDGYGTIDVVLSDPEANQIALSALTWTPTSLLAILMMVGLVLVLRVARATPFTPDIRQRLRRLGVFTAVGGCVVGIVEALATFVLAGTVTGSPSATLTLAEPLLWAVLGLSYLGIAEIIQRGTALRDELDEVI